MKPNLFPVIIWPLAQVVGTVIIMISSPKDRNHHVSRLMLKTNPDDGSWAFTLCSVSDVCAECLRHGRTEKECQHQISTVPDHISSTNARLLEEMYDDKDMAVQELKGNPELHEELVFHRIMDTFRHALDNPYYFEEEVQVIYTFFDPSGGGRSNATIVSHAPGSEGNRVLIGMDSCPRSETNDGMQEKYDMIARHFLTLRQNIHYRSAWIFVAVEANSSTDYANDVGKWAQHVTLQRVTVLRRIASSPTWMGVVTTAEEKRKWANYTTALLVHNKLRVARDLVGGGALDVLFPQLLDEMSRYRRRLEVVNEGKDNETRRESFTGKVGGKQDDLVTAMLGSLWQHKVLVAEDRNKSDFYQVVNEQELTFL